MKSGVFDSVDVIILTSAQVKALRATPIILVPAPGPGMVNQFLDAVFFLDYAGSNAFTGAAPLAIRLGDGAGPIVSEAIAMAGFIDQTGDMRTTARAKIDAIATKAQCEYKALVLHNTSGAEITGNAAGNNTLRIHVFSRSHVAGWS